MDFTETETDWSVQQSQGETFAYFTNNNNGCYTVVTVKGYRQQLMYTSCISDTFKYILALVHGKRTSEILLAISSDHNVLKNIHSSTIKRACIKYFKQFLFTNVNSCTLQLNVDLK